MNGTRPVFAQNVSQCRDGSAQVVHLRQITYFPWWGEQLTTVPNFPAWVCDMCGKREYDERAISWLTMLLSPNAGEPTQRIKRPPRADSPKRNIPRPPID